MRTAAVPSKDALRYLRPQYEVAFNLGPTTYISHQSIRLSPSPARRRRFGTSKPRCAKPQSTLIDDLWPRHRDATKALPAPHSSPQPSNTRHASNATNTTWWNKWWESRRHGEAHAARMAKIQAKAQARLGAAHAKAYQNEHGVPIDNKTFEDTSAQLFNLSRALSRNPSGADLKLRCTEFDSNGSVTLVSGEFRKSELIAKYGLLPRDLRKIDSSVLPHILVRPSAILINLLHLRVLIQSDRVLVFDAYGSTDSYTQSLFMYDLEGKLRQKPDPRSPATLPYEFRALEAVLISVTSGLEAEFALVRDPVTHILSALEEDIDREKLRHLLIHSKKLGTFEQKARLVRDAIDDLLNADDDLAAMYLTSHKTTDTPREDTDHQEVEMLLESYHKICDEIVEISGNLISNIRNTEEVVKAILDANRNQLMLFEIKVSVGTLGLAGGTLIAGLYGMNLNNFIEETNWGFSGVTAICFGLSAIIATYGMRKLRKVQKVRMWGEGLEGVGRRDKRIDNRGNWNSEAIESHAANLKRLREAGVGSGGPSGPVLWPGMEGLGMHKLNTVAESRIADAVISAQSSQGEQTVHAQAQAQVEKRGPSMTIHDDIENTLDNAAKRMGQKGSGRRR